MFYITIKDNNGREHYFFRLKNGKSQIFTFNTIQTAQNCIKQFQNYSIERLIRETGDLFATTEVMQVCTSLKIEEVPPKFNVETVSFEEVMKEKGYEI